MLAFYFTLANLPSYMRSKVDQIQLLLMCKEDYVSDSKIADLLHPVLRDLHVLEKDGIDVGLGRNIRGSVLCLTGDNLGSHFIGGFANQLLKCQIRLQILYEAKRELVRLCQ